MKNLKTIVAIAIVAIMLLVVALPTNAAFEEVTVNVTSNVGNGTEVKPGDEIIYNVKMKNTSANDYLAPTILVIVPDQTEIIDIDVDQDIEDDMKQVNNFFASCTGLLLETNSEVNFKVTVKINEDAAGEIKFANVTESDEEGWGAVIVFLINSEATNEELNKFDEVMSGSRAYNTIEEAQADLGDNIYFNTITQPQINPIKEQATAEEPKTEEPKAEEPKTEEPKTEEPKTEEPKTEEPKAEESKTEEPKTEEPKTEEPKTEEPKTEEKKEESTNKPTKLPKTGIEYSAFVLVAGIIMLALGIKLVK